MKKLILITLLGGFALTSCQKEDLSSVTELDAVEGRGKSSVNNNGNDDAIDESFCLVDLTPELPETVEICITDKGEAIYTDGEMPSYFDLTLEGNFFDTWCADQDTSLDIPDGQDEICLDGSIYSSYDEYLLTLQGEGAGEFEKPENFDLVNWLLNQNFVGKESSAWGPYTYGDIQKAIWDLIDNSTCTECLFLGEWEQLRVDELVSLADSPDNDGYKPGDGDLLALVIIPDGNYQSVIITIPLECKEVGCETAFGRAQTIDDVINTCFIDLEDPYKFNRWGWTVELPSEGTYTFDIYAGAGQCDLSKGTLVGTAAVDYSGGTVTVDYDISDGFGIKEIHTYAGYDPVPENPNNGKPTVAPGQYTIATGLKGEINVILHSVICGDY